MSGQLNASNATGEQDDGPKEYQKIRRYEYVPFIIFLAESLAVKLVFGNLNFTRELYNTSSDQYKELQDNIDYGVKVFLFAVFFHVFPCLFEIFN